MRPRWRQDEVKSEWRWSRDGPKMVSREAKRGEGAEKAGVATNAIKGTLFSLFRHPGGRSEAKMEAKWGRDEAKSGQDEAKMEAR